MTPNVASGKFNRIGYPAHGDSRYSRAPPRSECGWGFLFVGDGCCAAGFDRSRAFSVATKCVARFLYRGPFTENL
jgi:hypothetical protein